MTTPVAIAAAAATGAIAGSFAVTAAMRSVEGAPWAMGRSRCDRCGVALSFAQTTPFYGYLRARGACAGCGGRIDPLHLAGEVLGAGMGAAAMLLAGPVQAAPLLLLGLGLMAAATVDLKARRLPDGLVALTAMLCLGLAAAKGPAALAVGLIAAAAATLLLLSLRRAASAGGRDPGLGLGDVKLIAALALWLGADTPIMVGLAALAGLAAAPWLRDPEGRLPFGPMIAGAAWIVGVGREAGAMSWAW